MHFSTVLESLSSPNAAELQFAEDYLSCTATTGKSACTSIHKQCCCLRRPAWCCFSNEWHILLHGTLWQFLSWLTSASASLSEKGGKNGKKNASGSLKVVGSLLQMWINLINGKALGWKWWLCVTTVRRASVSV